jgi:bacillithiol biosynthesis cysteine-adding enzyme BshC
MRLEKIELDEAHCFSGMFLDYIKGNESLKPFYENLPHIDQFESQIEQKSFSQEKRDTLVEVLSKQYKSFEISGAVSRNIDLLKENNSYTITTGHQLNIFTGPLYFIYKIVTVINACKQLKAKFPQHNFVPVYWMASEDHDFEEISYFNLGDKKYTWDTDQTGAVGHFDPSSIDALLKQLPGEYPLFEKAYLSHNTLAEAARYYVNELFGNEGLVVIDADDRALKAEFTPVIEDDLFTHSAEKLVAEDTAKLQELGYKTQVHAREINFFYLEGNVRGRLEKEGDRYIVVDTDLSFSTDEIKSMIKDTPERFSPNVILRPLYQEMILPNLAYVGGPSEAIYWLQLKSNFAHFGEAFPILMPRNFALIIDKVSHRKYEKSDRSLQELFLPDHKVEERIVSNQTTKELSLVDELETIASTYTSAQSKAKNIDPSLVQHLEALQAKTEKLLDKAQKKMYRAEKRNHTDKIDQYISVKSVLFPKGNLQERTSNFLNFYPENPALIQDLLDNFDAFDYRMNVLIEE